MNLIKSSILTYQFEVFESDIRAAVILEAAEKHGLAHEGKLIPGVTAVVKFDGRRGSNAGGYTITLRRDVSKSGQACLPQFPPPPKPEPIRGA
jgi:hypothetical protein